MSEPDLKSDLSLKEFLEKTPPSSLLDVRDLAVQKAKQYGHVWRLNTPDLTLPCSHEKCQGDMQFRANTPDQEISDTNKNDLFVVYFCSNCRNAYKRYSLCVTRVANAPNGTVYKYGELPPFGPRTPNRLIDLIEPDRELFLKGRQCEIHGQGIGAYAYYRRVVENEKNRILDKIIAASNRLGADQKIIKELEAAKEENQFKTAVKKFKEAIPAQLMIKGQNPLTLLHDALSSGVHAKTDAECLQRAQSIRIILVAMSSQISHALKDDAELTAAVSELIKARQQDQ